MKIPFYLFFTLCLLAGCSTESGDEATTSGEHVWKAQTDSLEKAKSVEGILQQDAAEKSRMIDQPE